MNTQQFKPGDRVKVGPPVQGDIVASHSVVLEGAEGVFVEVDADGSWKVDFAGPASALLPLGSGPWWIDHRRLTLVENKPQDITAEPVEPAAPLLNDGGPAFPTTPVSHGYDPISPGAGTGCSTGMTLRQYAAIKLCVPDSGTTWLDEMIKQSLKDRFAGQERIDQAEEFGWPLLEELAGPRPKGGWDTNAIEWFNWSNKWQAAVRHARATAMMERRAK